MIWASVPTGLLRLAVPRAVVPLILEPVIASFCRAYPEIELEIAASDEMVDLAAGGFDAGIRLGQFIAPDMVAVRLTRPFPFVRRRQPRLSARDTAGRSGMDDLRHHACLRIAPLERRRSRPGPSPTATSRSRRSSQAR